MDTSVVASNEKASKAILIVDKKNIYGEELGKKFASQATVLLVSEKKPNDPNIAHIPFSKRIPEIPHGEYSHIFLISEDENEEHELLAPLAVKSTECNGKFIYVTSYWLYTKELEEKIKSLCIRWSLVLVGDVFPTPQFSKIQTFFLQAAKKSTITLDNLGLQTLRPVGYEDVVSGIVSAGLGLEKGGICYVFSKHPYTELSVVHGLQRIDPMIRIDFVVKDSEKPFVQLPEGTFMIGPEYPVMKKIQDQFQKYSPKSEGKHQATSIFSQQKLSSPRNKKRIFHASIISVFAICFFLLLPVFFTHIAFFGGNEFLQIAGDSARNGKLSQAQLYAQTGTNLFYWAANGINVLKIELSLFGQQNRADGLQRQIHSNQQLGQIMTLFFKGGSDLQGIMLGKVRSPAITLTEGTNAIKNGLVLLQTLDNASVSPSVRQEISNLRPLTNLVSETVDVWANLFGFDKPKEYVILFEDNTELRPGGGVIDSYAVVKIHNGVISEFTIHNVQDADGRLVGQVEPPFALRRYVPSPHWYLRDSNFSTDNIKNSQAAAFFLQQETGITVDGVVSVDLPFVVQILKTVGNTYVPEYNQTVTPDDFYSLMQSHAQKNVSAGTTLQKSFLTTLLSALEIKLFTQNTPYIPLLNQGIQSIGKKDLLFAFSDQSIQQIFTVNGLSSAIWDDRVPNGDINDFTSISEANLGNNKVNPYIKRKIFQNITIDKTGTASGALKIVYNNTSGQIWPGGAYKAYVRFVLPAGTSLTNILFNGVAQSRYPAVIDPKQYEAVKFVAPKGVEIEQTVENGRVGYAFLVQVGVGATFSVEVDYSLTQKLDATQSSFSYNGLLFKQPGASDDQYTLSINYPMQWELVGKPSGAVVASGNTQIITSFDTDKNFVFTFAKP